MSYLVNKTDGTLLVRVFDGQTDSPTSPTGHSSITLIGKQVTNYGEIQNENFIHILENFSNETSPVYPLQGQLWWSKLTNSLNVYNGTAWKPVTGFTSSNTTPNTPAVGDQWWDTSNDQYKIYNGTSWLVVGPSYSKNDGLSGAVVENVYDISSVKHTVIKIYHNGNVTAIMSRDSAFTPNVSITGFTVVNPGITFTTEVNAIKVYGTATNSDTVGNISPSAFLRNDIDSTTSANLSITKQLNVGTNSELRLAVASGSASIGNYSLNKGISLKANVGGTIRDVISVDGATGLASVIGDPTANYGIATKNYVLVTENSLRDDYSDFITANVATVNNSITTNVNSLSDRINAANVAIGTRAPIDSPIFVGLPQSVTMANTDSSNSIATTKFVSNLTTIINNSLTDNVTSLSNRINAANSAIANSVVSVNDNISGNTSTLGNRIDAANVAIALRANIDSPTFTGIPLSTTPSPGDNSTKIATTAFVTSSIGQFDKSKIYYDIDHTYVLVDSNGVNITVDGTQVLSVQSDGMRVSTPPANNDSTLVATTAYADRATKNFILNTVPYKPTVYVKSSAPDNGIGNDGDFWYQY